MPRRARVVVAGMPVHVMQRGHDRNAIFFQEDDYWRYLNDLRIASSKTGCAVHAYVLMTNHVHLVLTPEDEKGLGELMRAVGSRYVRFINLCYKRRGTLWEGRYRSALIQSERYLMTCYRYVELNPVRAKMVSDPAGYPWSSYHHNALGKTNQLIKEHELYLQLGEVPAQRQVVYKSLFDELISQEQAALIQRSTMQDSVLGNDKFRTQIEVMLGRSLAVNSHGGARRSRPPSP